MRCTIFALLVLSIPLSIRAKAQVDEASLTAALLNKSVTPSVPIGYSASTKNPVMDNGRPAEFPVKTQILPNGHEHFRIEYGILRTDAATYTIFKSPLKFRITKVAFAKDHLQVDIQPDGGDKHTGSVQFMFSKDWEQHADNATLLHMINGYLPDDETVKEVVAEAQALRAQQDSEEAAQKAAEARAAADAAREESVRAALKAAQQEKNAQDAREAEKAKFAYTPKVGKPSYTETASWIMTNMPKLNVHRTSFDGRNTDVIYTTIIHDMKDCVLSYTSHTGWSTGKTQDFDYTVPLSDALSAAEVHAGRNDTFVSISTRHYGTPFFQHEDDYDSNALGERMANAFRHAIQLCQIPEKKSAEPF